MKLSPEVFLVRYHGGVMGLPGGGGPPLAVWETAGGSFAVTVT
jgi:hypothetical protein